MEGKFQHADKFVLQYRKYERGHFQKPLFELKGPQKLILPLKTRNQNFELFYQEVKKKKHYLVALPFGQNFYTSGQNIIVSEAPFHLTEWDA